MGPKSVTFGFSVSVDDRTPQSDVREAFLSLAPLTRPIELQKAEVSVRLSEASSSGEEAESATKELVKYIELDGERQRTVEDWVTTIAPILPAYVHETLEAQRLMLLDIQGQLAGYVGAEGSVTLDEAGLRRELFQAREDYFRRVTDAVTEEIRSLAIPDRETDK